MKIWLPPPALHGGYDSWKQEVHTSQEWKKTKKPRVIETLFYIQFQGLCLKVWVWKDYLWARKVQEMKLSYYIRFRSFLDSVQKVHSQKLLKVKTRVFIIFPSPRNQCLQGSGKHLSSSTLTRVLSSHWRLISGFWDLSDIRWHIYDKI